MVSERPADQAGASAPTERVTCAVCSAGVAGPAPLTWSTQSGPRGPGAVGDRCTREHLRSIEAKLEPEWW